jgi:uncharacterized protein (DUF58 family)
MIVPRSRLIILTALVMLTLGIAAAAAPSQLAGILLVGGAFVLLAVMDALVSLGRLDGVRVTMPEIVRLTKDREGELDLTIENERMLSNWLRLGLALPAELWSPFEDIVAKLPLDASTSHVRFPCLALKRGNYVLDSVYLEAMSAIGLWAIRKAQPARCEIRVYPNTMREKQNLAGLFLNRGMFGIHSQRQLGKGREFEKLREYIPGDGYEDIHWKATAKRSFPVTKVFQIERTQEVYVVIDSSRLSGRVVELPSQNEPDSPEAFATTQLERFITAAMILGLVAERQNDLFGVLAFDDRIRAFVRAKNGKAHYGACREALYALEPKPANPDFAELCSFIRQRLRRRALLIFLTNLDDPVLAENLMDNLDLVSRNHLVLVNMLGTPDTVPLFSDPSVSSTDDIYQRLGGHIQWHRLRELQKALRHRGVAMSMLNNEKMCPQLVSQYVGVKRRQLL